MALQVPLSQSLGHSCWAPQSQEAAAGQKPSSVAETFCSCRSGGPLSAPSHTILACLLLASLAFFYFGGGGVFC